MPYGIMLLRKGEREGQFLMIGEQIHVYLSAEVAAAYAQRYNDDPHSMQRYYPGAVKAQPRQLPTNDNWEAEIKAKFEKGELILPPWVNEPWYGRSVSVQLTYAHLVKQPDGNYMVKYLPRRSDGPLDRWLSQPAASYLTFTATSGYIDYYHVKEDFGTVLIPRYAAMVEAMGPAIKVQFATTREDMVEAYIGGPQSCMAYPTSNFRSAPIHPVEVYAGGDLAIAYLPGKKARSLCWPEKKMFGRLYGDTHRLMAGLVQLGYKQVKATDTDNMNGARLLALSNNKDIKGQLVTPYLDFGYGLGVVDNQLVLGSPIYFSVKNGGIYYGGSQHGTFMMDQKVWATLKVDFKEPPKPPMIGRCNECNAEVRQGEGCIVYDVGPRLDDMSQRAYSHLWCNRCSDGSFTCEYSSERWSNDFRVLLAGGRTWAIKHFLNHGFTCRNGYHYAKEDGLELDDGSYVSFDYYMANDYASKGLELSKRGRNLWNRYMNANPDGWYNRLSDILDYWRYDHNVVIWEGELAITNRKQEKDGVKKKRSVKRPELRPVWDLSLEPLTINFNDEHA